jgi:putative colanic acid biosynthesis glycosyltransferase WcaI
VATSKTIVLLNQYFYPDMAATSQLLGDLSQYLGANAWEVVALAGRGNYAKSGTEVGSTSGRIWSGVTVKRVWSTDFGRRSSAGRLCDYLTFLVSAATAVAVLPKPDVVICLSTPPFVVLVGLIAKIKGSRLVYKVEDLYPEVAVALSKLREGSLLARSFSWLSRFLLRRADRVVALDRAMANRLLQAGAQSVEVIPNWADGVAIHPDSKARQIFRQAEGLEGKLVVLYSGNLGLAHRFDAVTETAKRCVQERPDALFLFVGSGPMLNSVREAVSGLSNVRFMPYQPRERLNELYNGADIHLVTLQDEVAGLLFPSKYPAALAAGKPVLLVGGGGAPFAKEIQAQQLGWVCPHQSNAVMDALRDAQENSAKFEHMARSARRVFEKNYSKATTMQRWEHVLNSALKVSPLDQEKPADVRSA